MHDFFEYHGIDILAKHIKKKPVSYVALFDNCVYDFPPDEPEPDVEQVRSHLGADDNNESVDDDEEAEHSQEGEPEPQEDVDFLVDNVEGQQAQRVVLLHLAGRPELVEGALGHSGEHVDQGV